MTVLVYGQLANLRPDLPPAAEPSRRVNNISNNGLASSETPALMRQRSRGAAHRQLRDRGADHMPVGAAFQRQQELSGKSAHGPWRVSQTPALSIALPLRFFDQMGVPSLARP
ncbi:MAG TPA: hypothetical protein PLO14_05055 [Accumulibacter sp.]|uniref:hypothetical protein n=1 Tax=Accumulibacter sp. TaxID=2053492 RepID=UPI0025E89678|nr:hypothetical protein [Accumulibacter sp.]MCM8599694.1 hypothetical protein [Accumulibacter sp.]HNC51593.1 hypothetical protein [Accumulibacter sp.]